MKVKVFLSLGSNIGYRARNVRAAVETIISDSHFKNVRISRFYESSPVGPKQRGFVNAALSAETGLSAAGLLKFVKETEKILGRKPRKQKWGPREIDIDILFYGKRVLEKKGLKIPHPEIANRLFVLAPLVDIAPGLMHPVLKKTVSKLRDALLLTRSGQKIAIIKTDSRKVKAENNG